MARFSKSLSKSNPNELDLVKLRNSLTVTLYPREVNLKLREKLVKRDVFKELFVDPQIKEEYVDHEILQSQWKYLDFDNSDFELIPKLYSSNKEAILLRVTKPRFGRSQLVVF